MKTSIAQLQGILELNENPIKIIASGHGGALVITDCEEVDTGLQNTMLSYTSQNSSNTTTDAIFETMEYKVGDRDLYNEGKFHRNAR